MGTRTMEPAKLPPVWFKHLFWRGHRCADAMHLIDSHANSRWADTPVVVFEPHAEGAS